MNDHHQHHETRNRSDSAEVAFRKIFVGGLSYSTDEDKLKKYFKVYGSVQDAVVMKDPVSKRSRGFGFITFYDVNSVDNALANEPHTIDSRKVEAKRAVPRSEIARDLGGSISGKSNNSSQNTSYNSTPNASPQISSYKSITNNTTSISGNSHSPNSVNSSYNQLFDSRHAMDPKINMEEYAYNKIFVGGLHYDTRDAEFRHYFERYGKVISAEVMFNRETHKSRGFGFIVFEQEQGAVKVCAEKEHIIDGKVVEVKRAIPRSRLSLNVTPIPSSPNKSLSTSPGDRGHPVPNVRQDVRRAMSMGSAQGSMSEDMSVSSLSSGGPYNLLGGTGSLTQQQQQKLSTMMPALTSNSSLSNAIRKPYNAAVANGPISRAVSGPTYAAALKLGNTTFGDVGGGDTLSSADLLSSSMTSEHSPYSSLLGGNNSLGGEFSSTSLGGNIDLQSLLYSSSLGADMGGVRQFRSFSEPIVKFDNSSLLGMPGSCASLNGDVLQSFENTYGRHSAISRSNNSSRSSSILMHDNSVAGNSRRQSFDQVGQQQQQQHQQSYSLGLSSSTIGAANEGTFNSLAWLSSPSASGLDGNNSSLDNSGLLSSTSSRHNSLTGLQLPSSATLHNSGSRSSFIGSASLDGNCLGGSGSTGALTPGTTVESLFGLTGSNSSTPISPLQQQFGGLNLSGGGGGGGLSASGGSHLNMTSPQALQLHQQQQAHFQQQHHLQQHQQHLQHQQQQNNLNFLAPSAQQGSVPSADTWASMVMSNQKQEHQQAGLLLQQQQQQQQRFPSQQYGDQQHQPPHMALYQHQHPSQQAFHPSAQQQHQQHQHQQMMYQQQLQKQQEQLELQQQQKFNQNSALFGASPQSLYSSPSHHSNNNQNNQLLNGVMPSAFPQFLSQPSFGLSGSGGLSADSFSASQGSERDELVACSDLHLDSQVFDPAAPWLYASKH